MEEIKHNRFQNYKYTKENLTPNFQVRGATINSVQTINKSFNSQNILEQPHAFQGKTKDIFTLKDYQHKKPNFSFKYPDNTYDPAYKTPLEFSKGKKMNVYEKHADAWFKAKDKYEAEKKRLENINNVLSHADKSNLPFKQQLVIGKISQEQKDNFAGGAFGKKKAEIVDKNTQTPKPLERSRIRFLEEVLEAGLRPSDYREFVQNVPVSQFPEYTGPRSGFSAPPGSPTEMGNESTNQNSQFFTDLTRRLQNFRENNLRQRTQSVSTQTPTSFGSSQTPQRQRAQSSSTYPTPPYQPYDPNFRPPYRR